MDVKSSIYTVFCLFVNDQYFNCIEIDITVNSFLFVVYQFSWIVVSHHDIKNFTKKKTKKNKKKSTNICHHIYIYILTIARDPRIYVLTELHVSSNHEYYYLSMPITTNVVRSNPTHMSCTRYNIM